MAHSHVVNDCNRSTGVYPKTNMHVTHMLPDLGSLFNFFSLVRLITVLVFCTPFILYVTLYGILWLVKPPPPPPPPFISFAIVIF